MKHIPGTKYISKNASGYLIQKYNKETQKMEYFYSSTSLIQTLMVRDLFIANNWDKTVSPYKTITGEKYIYKDHKGFSVRKEIDGRMIHFGYFPNLEEAILERDLLIAFNWDWELLCEFGHNGKSQWLSKYGKNQFQTKENGRIDHWVI